MKKISFLMALILLPICSFGNTYKVNNVYKYKHVASANKSNKKSVTSKYKPRFFLEYELGVFSDSPIDIDIKDATGINDMIKTKSFNGNSGLYMGADFNGIQLGIETSGDSGLKLKGTVPFFDWVLQPYLSAEIGVSNIDIYIDLDKLFGDGTGQLEVDDFNLTYAFGAGVKYNITDNFFVKTGIKYDIKKYEINLDLDTSTEEIDIDMSGLSVNLGIGYRF